MTWLGIDMGGTATRWVRCDARGDEVARGAVAGATGLVFDAAARAAFEAALAGCAAQAGNGVGGAAMKGAVLGITGAGLHPDAEITRLAARALGLAADRVVVLNDMELAWRAAFAQGGGHLVLAGTGSVGMSIDAGGTVTLVGGRGSLIDDAGSGAWIALRALDAVWRAIDAAGRPEGVETLARHLFAAIGGSEWEDTRRYVYGRDRGAIAALAPAVAAAARDGDARALALMEAAGRELARLARDLIGRCGAAPVRVSGGVLALHPALGAALRAALPGVDLAFVSIDPAARAARMAREKFAGEPR